MIEKFTKEELAQIRSELDTLPKAVQKRTISHDSFNELAKLCAMNRKEYDGIYFFDIEDNIFSVIDHAMCNYEKNPKREGKYRRRVAVPPELVDEYKEFVGEITELIKKHFK